jgi:hypothetical protein
MVFGFDWGVVKWNESFVTGITAVAGTELISVFPIIVAVQFLTQFFVLDISHIHKEPISKIHKTSPFIFVWMKFLQ